MRLSIRIKVLVAVSIALIVLFACIIYILVRQNTNSLRGSLNEQSKSFASLSSKPIGDTFALYKDSGRIKITQRVNSFLELDPDVTAIKIVSVDGKEVFSSLNEQNPPLDSDLASAFEPQYITDSNGYIDKIIQPYFEDSGAHRYSLVYLISTKRAEENLRSIVRLIMEIGVAALALSITGTGLLLNTLFIKPLKDVSQSANIISAGDFDHKIVSKRHDEIGDLASSVQKMADYLKADIAKLRELDKLKSEFMMITSHNLRTPITIMEGYIELAESAQSAEELKGIVNTIKESVVRLHLLAENVLTISTFEAGSETPNKAATDMTNFIESIGSQFALLAQKKGLKWQFDNNVPPKTKIAVSSNNMRSALGNLIDNAIKFTKTGGFIKVESKIENDQFVFSVTDSGIGISKEELGKLFTKFHRGTSTLSYDYEGIGIGLYLTKLIVEQHGGQIKAESELNKGSTFTVTLPMA